MAEGRKYDGDKLRYDLLPTRPLAEVVRVYTIGAKKYADRNWELGIEWGRVYGALQRHANAWWGGERMDPKDGQNHLASVVWCALALMEFEATHPELDDRGEKEQAPAVPLHGTTLPAREPTSIDYVSGTSRVQCHACGMWYNARDTHGCI